MVSAECPWESLVITMARVVMTYMAYKLPGKQGRSCDGGASGQAAGDRLDPRLAKVSWRKREFARCGK